VGTELAAASAMECVDRILADLGRTRAVAGGAPEPTGSLTARRVAEALARSAARPIAWATRA